MAMTILSALVTVALIGLVSFLIGKAILCIRMCFERRRLNRENGIELETPDVSTSQMSARKTTTGRPTVTTTITLELDTTPSTSMTTSSIILSPTSLVPSETGPRPSVTTHPEEEEEAKPSTSQA
uniref:Uncharacterized protein n=1 Tax=Vespula pensylvanica TaxID=30213 RepID=A0A834NL05_VESPE|nr:hypothetical protein H0235_012776 [Vespula pensylvanica]